MYDKKVVSFWPFKQLYSSKDPLLYKDFKSTNKSLIACLKKITNNQFFFGALAFIEAHKVWRVGKIISLGEYAQLFLDAVQNHTKPLDERAFIRSMQDGMSRKEWKQYRQKKVDQVIAF